MDSTHKTKFERFIDFLSNLPTKENSMKTFVILSIITYIIVSIFLGTKGVYKDFFHYSLEAHQTLAKEAENIIIDNAITIQNITQKDVNCKIADKYLLTSAVKTVTLTSTKPIVQVKVEVHKAKDGTLSIKDISYLTRNQHHAKLTILLLAISILSISVFSVVLQFIYVVILTIYYDIKEKFKKRHSNS